MSQDLKLIDERDSMLDWPLPHVSGKHLYIDAPRSMGIPKRLLEHSEFSTAAAIAEVGK